VPVNSREDDTNKTKVDLSASQESVRPSSFLHHRNPRPSVHTVSRLHAPPITVVIAHVLGLRLVLHIQ
jgi:hypothetical protein